MRPPTVFHFLGYDEDRGGVLSAIRLIAARSPGRRHVLVVNPGFVQRRRPELPLYFCPPIQMETISARSALATWIAAWLLLREVASGTAVVHGQSRTGMLVAFWLWLLGQSSVVASPHCYGRARWLYRWVATCLGDRWSWLSPAMKLYYGAGARTWHRCIPEPAARPADYVLRPRIADPTVITLGGAGTLVPWKGWHLILEALLLLAGSERSRFKFVHIGDTDGTVASRACQDELGRLVERGDLGGQVEWRGWQADSATLLAEIDVLLVTSEHEPMALAGLEALAAGVPVLIADSGGLPDVVTPGVNALIFRTGDAADLAARLRELLTTDFLQRSIGQSGPPGPTDAAAVAAAWELQYAWATGGPPRNVI